MTYEPARFADLVPVRQLVSTELAEHVVHWPDGVIVDVRACATCQGPIARLARDASGKQGISREAS